MNTQLREEELSSRMRLRFGLQQCRQSNFSQRPLYKCTHTFKVSFSQCGTLAFAACLSNLTSKASEISPSLTLSSLCLCLSHYIISPCEHAYEITLFQRLCVYHAHEESRIRSETQLRMSTHTLWCTNTKYVKPSHIEPVFPHTFTHREGNREEEEHWLRFFAFLCICECLECTLNTYKHQMRTVLVCLWKLRALGKLLRFVNVAFLAATIAVAQPVYQSLAREQHPARWPRSDTLDC